MDLNGRKLFVIMASRGEYSDCTEWPVAGYFNEQAAANHVVEATRWVKEQAALWMANRHRFVRGFDVVPTSPYDPSTDADSVVYNETSYTLVEIPAVFDGDDGKARPVVDRHERAIDLPD